MKISLRTSWVVHFNWYCGMQRGIAGKEIHFIRNGLHIHVGSWGFLEDRKATYPLWRKLKVLRVLTSVSGHAPAAAFGRNGRTAVAAFPAAAVGFSEEPARPAGSVSTPVTVQTGPFVWTWHNWCCQYITWPRNLPTMIHVNTTAQFVHAEECLNAKFLRCSLCTRVFVKSAPAEGWAV